MARNMQSAKKAGASFERSIANALAQRLDDYTIDRRVRYGGSDRGDIGGVRLRGERVVIECKNVTKIALPEWTREARIEAGNDDALCGVVVHKRHGVSDPLQQWVSMTLEDFVAILTGQRVEQ